MDDNREQPRGLDAFVETNLSRLQAFVRLRMGRLLSAKESSIDIVQSSLREVLQRAERDSGQSDTQFRHAVYRAAEYKILQRARYYRAQKRDAAREQPAPAAGDTREGLGALECLASLHTPSQLASAREQEEKLARAFAKLSKDYQDVIVLSRVIGMGHAEIAAEMGRSEIAVRTLLSRALVKLTGLFEQVDRRGSA